MRKEAFVIIDFDIVGVAVTDDNATQIPIDPSLDWPKIIYTLMKILKTIFSYTKPNNYQMVQN